LTALPRGVLDTSVFIANIEVLPGVTRDGDFDQLEGLAGLHVVRV
jgi:hypothetical protein